MTHWIFESHIAIERTIQAHGYNYAGSEDGNHIYVAPKGGGRLGSLHGALKKKHGFKYAHHDNNTRVHGWKHTDGSMIAHKRVDGHNVVVHKPGIKPGPGVGPWGPHTEQEQSMKRLRDIVEAKKYQPHGPDYDHRGRKVEKQPEERPTLRYLTKKREAERKAAANKKKD